MIYRTFADRMKLRASAEEEVKKHGVFDIGSCTYGYAKMRFNKRCPCSPLVNLYAKMGLDRYNLLEGTKFQLKRVKKYIQTTDSLAATYYITLDATDPTRLHTSFQTKVSEDGYGSFFLTCDITRIRGEAKDEVDEGALIIAFPMPEWPPENPFDHYYRVKKSELHDNDCIRLYLELAVATQRFSHALPNLEIVNVAIRHEGLLNAKNATFYIRYNDLSKAALGEVSDCIAIVTRSFDEDTGCFILLGQTRETSEVIPTKRNIIGLAANEDTGCFSLKGQNQSSEITQFTGGFGVDKPFADNKGIKLHLTGLANQICEDHQASNQQAVNSDSAGVSMEY